ncbi:MAG: UDP-N-acetylmuramoyl-tripeptide--D-alanyl-D-alanine ligase, partial [Deltaproteobacteria bacterium]|nr:UDP-N-acetylmuramoyl-tripeptide--D-alanyl-D-alanine ligase [Deltaproteobacteria bacterium]
MELKLKEIIEATGGRLAKGSAEALIKGVSTDSRKIAVGEAFFALRGPSFDGHSFVRDVLFKGAAAAIVDKMESAQGLQPGANIVLVDDALSALGRLASYYRGLFNIPFVAVSGSAGKTTTKEMIAAILSRSRPVLKTEGNKNNLIGLPLTLFGLEKRHEAAVVELGISEFWEMERLTDICRPDIAVLTNIGRGHLKTLGTLEGVAKAKGALFAKLGPGGVRAVNLDDPWVVRLADKGGKAVTYSVKKDADVRVRDYSVDESFKGMSALYEVKGSLVPVRFSTPALTNLLNGA